MNVFKEETGKYSSKRIIGFTLIVFFIVIVILKIFFVVADVSDTILGSILGGGLSSSLSTLFKQPK